MVFHKWIAPRTVIHAKAIYHIKSKKKLRKDEFIRFSPIIVVDKWGRKRSYANCWRNIYVIYGIGRSIEEVEEQ